MRRSRLTMEPIRIESLTIESLTIVLMAGREDLFPTRPTARSRYFCLLIFAFCLENTSLRALCENSVGRRPCAAAGPPAGIFMPLGGHPAMRVCHLIFF